MPSTETGKAKQRTKRAEEKLRKQPEKEAKEAATKERKRKYDRQLLAIKRLLTKVGSEDNDIDISMFTPYISSKRKGAQLTPRQQALIASTEKIHTSQRETQMRMVEAIKVKKEHTHEVLATLLEVQKQQREERRATQKEFRDELKARHKEQMEELVARQKAQTEELKARLKGQDEAWKAGKEEQAAELKARQDEQVEELKLQHTEQAEFLKDLIKGRTEVIETDVKSLIQTCKKDNQLQREDLEMIKSEIGDEDDNEIEAKAKARSGSSFFMNLFPSSAKSPAKKSSPLKKPSLKDPPHVNVAVNLEDKQVESTEKDLTETEEDVTETQGDEKTEDVGVEEVDAEDTGAEEVIDFESFSSIQLKTILTPKYIRALIPSNLDAALVACNDANLLRHQGLNVHVLQAFCKSYGLSQYGSKKDVISRLKGKLDSRK